jgi:hypothetical protein
MSEKIVKIGRWEVPSKLFDDYVKFSIMADGYLMGTLETPSVIMGDYERKMRWSLCVEQLMKIHRQICDVLKIDYSEDASDEFYSAFHREVENLKRLRG